jgi:hypothetical protein
MILRETPEPHPITASDYSERHLPFATDYYVFPSEHAEIAPQLAAPALDPIAFGLSLIS